MRAPAYALLVLALGCGGPAPSEDAGLDAGASADAGVPSDGAASDAARTDAARPDAALPSGPVWARLRASREVVRQGATGAPVSDSETTLSAAVAPSVGAFAWRVERSESGEVVFTSTDPSPVFTCASDGRGAYDVVLTVSSSTDTATYRERRLVTCVLPRVDAGRRVHTLDLASGNTYLTGGAIGGVVVMPGDVIRVRGAGTTSLVLRNFHGTREAPIHIVNDGLVTVRGTAKLFHLLNCRHVIIDGLGDDARAHGFVLGDSTTGEQALFARNYTEGPDPNQGQTGLEIYGVHIEGEVGSGIQIDTDGSAAFNRDNWRMEDVVIHHNLVENTTYEGFYIGHTRDWIRSGTETALAYQIYDAKIYRNTVRDTGNDGIQVCNCVEGLEVHDNRVERSGLGGDPSHSSSVQYNPGNGGFVYRNVLRGGSGLNAQMGCTGGDAYFYANVIETDAGDNGAYAIAGRNGAASYYFFDNTFRTGANGVLLNLGSSGCDESAEPAQLAGLYAVNNVFVLPDGQVGGRDPVAYRLDSPRVGTPETIGEPNVVVREAGIDALCFRDAAAGDYAPACDTSPALAASTSPVVGLGGLDASALPGGAFVDATGRELTDPRTSGAHATHDMAAPAE